MISSKTSIFLYTDMLSAVEAKAAARLIEAGGYGALWLPEAFGREVFNLAAFILANTSKLVVGTAIANIYARDAKATAAAQLSLAEQSDNRFFLGLGVSHTEIVSALRGHAYGKPVSTMRAYLEEMKAQNYTAPMPSETPKTIIAALRPKMLELARELTDGAIPYGVTPEHTARARAILGKDRLLYPMLNVMLETDPAKARAAARTHIGLGMAFPNYQNSIKEQGFTSEDFENGCSDRLMDAMVAWGDEDAVRKRIDEMLAAGADHVVLQPISSTPRGMLDPDMKIIELLAPNRR